MVGMVSSPSVVTASEVSLESPLKSAPHRIMTSKGPIHPNATPLELDARVMSRLKSVRPGARVRFENLLLEPGLVVDLEVERIQPFAVTPVLIMSQDDRGMSQRPSRSVLMCRYLSGESLVSPILR